MKNESMCADGYKQQSSNYPSIKNGNVERSMLL